MNSPLTRITRALCLLLAAVISVLLTGLSVPSSAWAAEESRAVTGFEAVVLEGAGRVRVELAERESVRVSGSAQAVESTQTLVETRDGVPTLVIRQKSRWWSSSGVDVQIAVQGPRFKALAVAGSGEIEARLSNQPALRLSIAGSGDLKVDGLTAHRVEVSISGSGDARVKGAAQNLTVSLAGSGDAWLQELEAEDVRVSVAGSGDVRVNARQRLRASLAGSGDVRHTGPARDVSHSSVGSGRLIRE